MQTEGPKENNDRKRRSAGETSRNNLNTYLNLFEFTTMIANMT